MFSLCHAGDKRKKYYFCIFCIFFSKGHYPHRPGIESSPDGHSIPSDP